MKLTIFKEGAEVPADNNHRNVKYPFDSLNVGMCFTVPIAEANETSLRLTSCRKTKEGTKRFTVIKHKEHGCIEVARIE